MAGAVGGGAAEADGSGVAIVSVGSFGGGESAQNSPTVKKRSAPTAGSQSGVLGSGGGGGP